MRRLAKSRPCLQVGYSIEASPPIPSYVTTAVDARRLRALVVAELERPAIAGDTLLSRDSVVSNLSLGSRRRRCNSGIQFAAQPRCARSILASRLPGCSRAPRARRERRSARDHVQVRSKASRAHQRPTGAQRGVGPRSAVESLIFRLCLTTSTGRTGRGVSLSGELIRIATHFRDSERFCQSTMDADLGRNVAERTKSISSSESVTAGRPGRIGCSNAIILILSGHAILGPDK